MISEEQFQNELDLIIANAVREDVGDGDHSSLSCIPASARGKAKLLVKDEGIIAGVAFAKQVFDYVDPNLTMEILREDGDQVKYGDIVFNVSGKSQSILMAERLVLNAMQRMSAIATKTAFFAELLKGTKTKILDTRKTTPGIRALEKWAVKIGGGENHRFALYDMVMIKDNHITSSDIKKLVSSDIKNKKGRKITVEVDNLKQLKSIFGLKFNTVLFDNMSIRNLKAGVKIAKKYYETEASGNVSLKNVKKIASTGVDRISIGKITHSAPSVDLKIEF